MSIKNSAERNVTLDCVKGLAIFLVLWGHSIQFLFHDGSESFFQIPIFKIIYMFHMPLFMAVSGYLFPSSERKYPTSNLLLKKANRLLLPVASWAVLMFVAKYTVHMLTGHAMAIQLQNVLWFLSSCMFCTVVAVLCGKIAGGHPAVYVSAFLLSLALPDSFQLGFDKFMLPYFIAGIMFYRYRSRIPKVTYKLSWGISLVLFCVLLAYWNTEYYIYTTGMSLYVEDPRHKLFIITVRYLAGFAGIGLIVPLVNMLTRNVIAKPLTYLGKYTMEIYVLSPLIFQFLYLLRVPHSNVLLYSWFTAPLASCLISVFCIYGAKVIQRSKRVSLFLLGA